MIRIFNNRTLNNSALAMAAGLAATAIASNALASTLSYTGGAYTQDFNSLPNPGAGSVNADNPVTISTVTYALATPIFDFAAAVDSTTGSTTGGLGLSATMPGWYGGAATATKFGANAGDQTTGGDLSFGPASSANRALGLIGTSSTGITYFGLNIVNNTATPLTTINLAFTGELWKQGTLQKNLSIGYTVDNANTLTVISAATSATELASISKATGTVGGVDGLDAANQTAVNLVNIQLGTAVGIGKSLWITGKISSAGGSGQGYGIDNLSFSATPEPASLSLLGVGGLMLLRRRRA